MYLLQFPGFTYLDSDGVARREWLSWQSYPDSDSASDAGILMEEMGMGEYRVVSLETVAMLTNDPDDADNGCKHRWIGAGGRYVECEKCGAEWAR
jgi:hypothetical protein